MSNCRTCGTAIRDVGVEPWFSKEQKCSLYLEQLSELIHRNGPLNADGGIAMINALLASASGLFAASAGLAGEPASFVALKKAALAALLECSEGLPKREKKP